MLSIPLLNKEVLEEFYDIVAKTFKSAISNNRTDANLKGFFTDRVIRELLIGEHDILIGHLKKFSKNVITQENFINTNKSINKKTGKRGKADFENIANYGDTVKSIKRIFDYDKIISGNKEVSYQIASLLNRNTCTYCNRQYTLTVSEGNNHLIRPQFDHWYPKSLYPVLALSIYNLIPSCAICNSSIKGSNPFNTTDHVHPYLDQDIINHINFSYGKTGVYENKVIIEISDRRVKETINAFKLEEIYRAHSDYELKDLLDLAKKYPKNYLENLLSVFEGLHLTTEEIYRMIFGIEYKSNDFHKRPFSKFKSDIISELLK